MGAEANTDWRQAVASALEWWRDAGVETLHEDEARDWLARAVPVREAPPAVASPPVETLPATLEEFVAWRLGEAAPEAGWMTPRIGPSGPADARLVVLVDAPGRDDSDTLLSGPAGRLFDRMLAAIGLARDSVYLTALAWARPVTGRIPPDEETRLIELARHHLTLLAPEKLLLLGQSASRVVPETSGAPGPNSLRDVNHFGRETSVAASYHPRFLMEHPAAKGDAWRHLLWLTRGSQ